MQYNNDASEESLLAADNVTLHVAGSSTPWHDCRVIKRDGKLIAQTSQGSSTVHERQIPDAAVVDQSKDGAIIVVFDDDSVSA